MLSSLLTPLLPLPISPESPFYSMKSMIYLSASYAVLMGALSFLRRGQKPLKLRGFSLLHNTLMSLYSLYTFVGVGMTLLANMGDSWSIFFCDPQHSLLKGDMEYWMYHFYLSKAYEWIDTALLILRGKPVFPPANLQYSLHVFHHLTTVSIVWASWHHPFSSFWIGPLTNSFVHFFMYGYYAATDVGLPRKFGLFITPLQLVQFLICIVWTTQEWIVAGLWGADTCGLNALSLGWIFACYVVFLYLFIKMFSQKKKVFAQDKNKRK